MWIATAAEMRAIEEHAVALGVSLETLMENAGRAVFEKLQKVSSLEDYGPGVFDIGVFCGKGNNGGDGLVVARLALQAGYKVTCLLAVESDEKLSDLCRIQLGRYVQAGGTPIFAGQAEYEEALGAPYDVWIDALLGTGLKGEPRGRVAQAIEEVRRRGWRTISIDLPSGVDSDTGQELGLAVMANWTVCLGLPKPFLFQGSVDELVGDWSIADIGIPPEVAKPKDVEHKRLFDVRPEFDARPRGAHKGDSNHVLIVAGSARYRGAASLAAMGALRAGAGLVTVASIEPVIQAVAAQVPEAILLPLPEEGGAIADRAAEIIVAMKGKFDSAVIGPGLTTAPTVKSFLQTLWKDWWIANVIDADALNLVAEGLELPNGLCILTPHLGEAARLLDTETKTVQAARLTAAKEILKKYGWPIVLKGANSIGALAPGSLYVNSTGNSGMATGGMGDVLSGVIAALLPDPLAGVKGMYLHGLAGDLAAEEIGGIGYSASDLAHFLPRARSILTT